MADQVAGRNDAAGALVVLYKVVLREELSEDSARTLVSRWRRDFAEQMESDWPGFPALPGNAVNREGLRAVRRHADAISRDVRSSTARLEDISARIREGRGQGQELYIEKVSDEEWRLVME